MLNLKIVRVNDDGTADCEFIYDKSLVELYQKETGAKTARKNDIGKFIVKYLTKNIDSVEVIGAAKIPPITTRKKKNK